MLTHPSLNAFVQANKHQIILVVYCIRFWKGSNPKKCDIHFIIEIVINVHCKHGESLLMKIALDQVHTYILI